MVRSVLIFNIILIYTILENMMMILEHCVSRYYFLGFQIQGRCANSMKSDANVKQCRCRISLAADFADPFKNYCW